LLGLTLREEFRGKRLKGTAIELSNDNKTGATQVAASEFLEITYPTSDLLKGLEATGPGQGRPLVILGERGLGKSHVMAALYHALTNEAATRAWLKAWAYTLVEPKLAEMPLRGSMEVITESLHRQRYKFLWDLLFDKHPHGSFIRGKWEGKGDAKPDVPSDELMLEMFKKQPTALLLDEFQTWYDSLTNTKQYPWKNWAFNFIQILSEIAKENPDLLVLVVSVRNGSTDAYQQIHRVNPVQVDFKGPRAQTDRRRLLLHRLFENRLQVTDGAIRSTIDTHFNEYARLLNIAPSEVEQLRRDFIETWPFAPHLLRLLEDQVLVATSAQETRDLIKILAGLFKARGNSAEILTAADFRLDDENTGIGALLDSVSNQLHASLREKALRNITSVIDAVANPSAAVPHLEEIMGSLWLRSIAVGNIAGAEPATLQIDCTRAKAIDDNAFTVELGVIVENSFNIHQEGSRLIFKEDENPQAKLMASARNDKLFADGSDQAQLRKEIRYVIGGSDDVAKAFRVIALPQAWIADPWSTLDPPERPDQWDERLPVVVLPEAPDKLDQRLGHWIKDNLQKRRNAVRFVIPRADSTNAYLDRDLIIMARAVLKAQEWKGQSPEYGKLERKYQTELRDILKKRFDRFAVVQRWHFADPNQSKFHIETLKAQGDQIPEAIEAALRDDLFVPEDFADLVMEAARDNASVGKLLRELQEPRPASQDAIPWLGEVLTKERILRICAKGKIAINNRGLETLQLEPGEDEETAWRRMRSRLGTGKHLDETFLMLPSAVPTAHGTVPQHQPLTNGPGTPTPDGPAPTPGAEEPQPSPNGPGTSSPAIPGGLFGGGGMTGGARMPLSSGGSTSALNLMGKLETWNIGPATSVHNVRVTLNAATGAQLQKLLKSLPDGLTYALDLEKEDGGS
jgi:hypothetical protein